MDSDWPLQPPEWEELRSHCCFSLCAPSPTSRAESSAVRPQRSRMARRKACSTLRMQQSTRTWRPCSRAASRAATVGPPLYPGCARAPELVEVGAASAYFLLFCFYFILFSLFCWWDSRLSVWFTLEISNLPDHLRRCSAARPDQCSVTLGALSFHTGQIETDQTPVWSHEGRATQCSQCWDLIGSSAPPCRSPGLVGVSERRIA